MGTEDFIDLHAYNSTDTGNEANELHNSFSEPSEVDCQPSCSQDKEDTIIEKVEEGISNSVNVDFQHVQDMDLDEDLVHKQSILEVNVKLTETIAMEEKMIKINSATNGEMGSPAAQNGSAVSNHMIDGGSVTGVKRARVTYSYGNPSVHVKYNSLTRASKRKLEELLQQWSQWHAQNVSSSDDSKEALESGEGTYFPAIHVGLEKSSTMSFWMDNQTNKQQSKEFIPLDGDSVPLYDRGYASVLTSADGSAHSERELEILEGSRCFNCGSYSHSLKDCPKPRDNAAVENARKQHNSKRNQTAGPRNATRYYQDSPGGKYDGIKPGALGPETRKELGLGELDPPPWLHRMREIGYPPGYLDPDEEDMPSGIIIYTDEERKKEQEDGEILETENMELNVPIPGKKMTVEFPGINAPIPEDADQSRWMSSRETSFDSSGSRLHHRLNRSSEVNDEGYYHDRRWSRDYRDDAPPGSDPADSPSMSGYTRRYSGYDPLYTTESHSPRSNVPVPRSPSLGRPLSDRGRRSPLVHDGSPGQSPYSSVSYPSPNARQSPQNYSYSSFENWAYESQHSSGSFSSSYRKDRHERHHHHHGRR